jgi:hypothetical protein
MSSIIKVDTIQDQDGNNIINENANTITIGKSGDTVTVASGATFVGGGIEWQSSIVTGTTLSAVAGKGYWIDTTSNTCTITLPASASVGDQLIFTDYARTWDTNNLTIDQNSLNYQGNSSPNPVYDTAGESVHIVYSGATQGWIPVDDGAVALETPQTYTVDFLVIAGGGGSAFYGAGGAGGYRTSTQSVTPGTTITVTVGDGGTGGDTSGNKGTNGSDSSISGSGLTTITSAGGGAGGGQAGGQENGGSGGSGGGGSASSPGIGGSGNTPSTSPSQGNNGGTGGEGGPFSTGGGGGGAGGTGGTGGASTAGNGGNGTASSITGSSVTRAGGGGGGTGPGNTAGTGGTGGGGDGINSGVAGTAGAANTGGGAGGSGYSPSGGPGAAGGKGVVILSMPDASYSGTTTGSPTVATGVSGKTVLTFTGSGSYTT